jgi:hypothetical protein
MPAREANQQVTTSWADERMGGWHNTNANTTMATGTTQKTKATVPAVTVATRITVLAAAERIEVQMARRGMDYDLNDEIFIATFYAIE